MSIHILVSKLNMKQLIFLFITFFYLSCQPKTLPTVINLNDENLTVKFSHESTRAEFEEVNKLLLNYDANLDYSVSKFFDDGKLRDLNIKLTLPNGAGGSLSANLTNLQYNYYGFILSLDGNGNASPKKFGAF